MPKNLSVSVFFNLLPWCFNLAFLHDKTRAAANNKQQTVEKCSLFSDRGNDLKAFVIEIRSVNHGVIPSVETIPVEMKRVTKDLNRVEKERIHYTRGILNLRSSEAQSERAPH